MAPRHTQGCGGAAFLATALPSCPTNQDLVCWLILPTPCLRRHPTLFLFGFRADALNSHFFQNSFAELNMITFLPPRYRSAAERTAATLPTQGSVRPLTRDAPGRSHEILLEGTQNVAAHWRPLEAPGDPLEAFRSA